jgi:zinc transport system substrate-binding protein
MPFTLAQLKSVVAGVLLVSVAGAAIAQTGMQPGMQTGMQTGSATAQASDAAKAVQPAETFPIRVVVTLPALKSFVEPFVPAGSEVIALMKPGKSEHNYEFSAGDLAQLSRADVVVIVGAGLEPQVETFLERQRKPGRQEVSFGATVGVVATEEGEAHVHDDGSTCTHAHGVDPHLWLDPVLVKGFVPAIRAAVLQAQVGKAQAAKKAVSQEERTRLQTAQAELIAKIDALHEEYKTQLAPLAGKAIVTHHDAFGRLAQRYGLKVAASIKNTHAAEASPQRIAEAVQAIAKQGAKAVFFEPQFDKSMAERIATAANVKLGMLDPLGEDDWFATMRANLKALVENLSEPKE